MKNILLAAVIFVASLALHGQTLLMEDFSGTFPPSGWTIDIHSENWSSSGTNYAGGSAPEAMFNFYPNFNGFSRMISPAFDLTGVTKVTLEFQHRIDNWSGGYYVGVATRAGLSGNWNTVWQIYVQGSVPSTFVSVPITNSDLGHPGFQYCFYFSGNTQGIDYWYIDNADLYIPYNHDIRAENILMGDQFVMGTPFTPSFQVRNIGRNQETFHPVFHVFDYQNNLIHTDSVAVTNLSMDYTKVINFPPYSPPGQDALYRAVFYPNLYTDMNHANDTLSQYFNTYTHLKQEVMMEIGTGTWCTYCPGASMGAEDLLSQGDSVAVIEYHARDSFTIPADTNRINFYQMLAYPTAIFDGSSRYEGGNHSQSMFPYYLPLYQQQIAIRTPFQLSIYGTHTGNAYSVDVDVQKLGQFINPRTILLFAVTESHIYYPWEGQDSLQYVNRLMVPDDRGTPINMTTTESRTVHLDFFINPSWVKKNLEISTFIQDSVTREIYNGNKILLSDLVINTTGNLTGTSGDRIGVNYPNPMVSCTSIPIFIAKEGNAVINLYSMTGGVVKILYHGRMVVGRHELIWDGMDDYGNRLRNGIYYVRLIKDGESAAQKIILNR